MLVKDWINENPKIVIPVTTASVLALILVFVLRPPRTARFEGYSKEWFYNLNTGELFVAETDRTKPGEVGADGQPAIARAHVLSYAYDPNESERFIGFLEIPDPHANQDRLFPSQSKGGAAERWGRGKLIRTLSDRRWVPADNDEGRALIQDVFRPDENGDIPTYCRPK